MSMEDMNRQSENFEGNESSEFMMKSFNPNDINVDIMTINLGSLIEQLEFEEIDLQPDFQRATDVWDNIRKSRLIESILLGLPLPSFYFSEDPFTLKLSIIDGLQRICAIKDFVLRKENPLKLKGLQFLSHFEGKTYSQLPIPEMRRIKSLKITVNVLRKGTPLNVKYIIYERINTGGIPLNQQEIRYALNQGFATVFLKELANMESFKIATDYSINSKRMQDLDFINRFIAFFIGYTEYSGNLNLFLFEKMREINMMSSNQIDYIRTSFDKSMKCCYQIFKEDTLRIKYEVTDRRRPVSKSVFDTLSVNVALLNDNERILLLNRAEVFKNKIIGLFNNEEFKTSITSRTTQRHNVMLRFYMVKSLIKEIISL